MAQGAVSLSLDELQVGSTCSYPIEGEGSTLLVAANTAITAQIIAGLRDRGFTSIDVDPRDLASLRGQKKVAVKRKVVVANDQFEKSKPVKQMLVDRFDEDVDPVRAAKISQCIDKADQNFDEVIGGLATPNVNPTETLQQISDGFARSMVDDHDQTISAMAPDELLPDIDQRSVRASAIGMALAIEMGLDGPQTLEVGTVGLLSDIGLHVMKDKFMGPTEHLSNAEWWEYQKHPLIAVDLVSDRMDLSASVLLAMQQVHEQFDGSGYPRGLKGQRIHLYARILNVVECYFQLTMPTSERSTLVPHDALGLMLHKAAKGLFDPQVIRAFLNIETLYPLGSMIELSSGDLATVIRRPRKGYSEPVLIGSDGDRLELEASNLKVMRPVANPKLQQKRMSKTEMASTAWHPASQAVVA